MFLSNSVDMMKNLLQPFQSPFVHNQAKYEFWILKFFLAQYIHLKSCLIFNFFLDLAKFYQSIETLTEALQKWMPRFLAYSFFALNSVLNKQSVLFFYSNQLNLSKYTSQKNIFKSKKMFARNLGMHIPGEVVSALKSCFTSKVEK